LPSDAGSLGRDDLTLEKVLEEKKTFDLSIRFEKLGTDEEQKGWSDKSRSTRLYLVFQTSQSYLFDT